MFHLPQGKTWDSQLLAEALRRRGVEATSDGERVEMALPVKRMEIEKILAGEYEDQEIVGFSTASLSFVPSAILWNLSFDCSIDFDVSYMPAFDLVKEAILDCGYDSGRDRELADKYYIGNGNLSAIFDEIEKLQPDKELAIAEGRFADAHFLRQQQFGLRQKIEDLLRNRKVSH